MDNLFFSNIGIIGQKKLRQTHSHTGPAVQQHANLKCGMQGSGPSLRNAVCG